MICAASKALTLDSRSVEGLHMYRRTKKYAARRQWRPRQEIPDDDQRPPRWQPPDLRRRITIEDFDGAEPMTHVIELHKTTRIDTYRARLIATAPAQEGK